MKTIQFITESINLMQKLQLPAKIEIGTFSVNSKGSLINWAGSTGQFNYAHISFQLKFRPDHIQSLLNYGVKIDFNSVKMADLSKGAKRYKEGRAAINQGRYAPYYYMGDPENKQTGVIENWLIANASCDPETLAILDSYSRDNNRNELAIHNDTVLRENGWSFKTKYSNHIEIESQYFNIKSIRKNAHGKPYQKLQPIEKRVLKIKQINKPKNLKT
jgi:hypothetical protein